MEFDDLFGALYGSLAGRVCTGGRYKRVWDFLVNYTGPRTPACVIIAFAATHRWTHGYETWASKVLEGAWRP